MSSNAIAPCVLPTIICLWIKPSNIYFGSHEKNNQSVRNCTSCVSNYYTILEELDVIFAWQILKSPPCKFEMNIGDCSIYVIELLNNNTL